MRVFSSDSGIARSDPMRLRWLSIADSKGGAIVEGQHLLEREVLGQDARGLDEPTVPRVDHLA